VAEPKQFFSDSNLPTELKIETLEQALFVLDLPSGKKFTEKEITAAWKEKIKPDTLNDVKMQLNVARKKVREMCLVGNNLPVEANTEKNLPSDINKDADMPIKETPKQEEPKKTFTFICKSRNDNYPLKVKDYLDLVDAIKEELGLTRDKYEIKYTFAGKECSMKTKRSFETFTDGGPNQNGTYDIKLVEYEEEKPAAVEEEKKSAAVNEKPKLVATVDPAEEDALTRMARIEQEALARK